MNTRQRIGLLAIIYILSIIFCNYSLGLFHFTDYSLFINYDTVSYVESAYKLIHHFEPHPFRCIGYGLILAIPYGLFGTSVAFFITIHVIQLTMLFIVYCLVYVILKYYVKQIIAFGMTILLMLNITFVCYAYLVLTEIPFLFFITISLFNFHLYLCDFKTKNLVLSFAFLCIAILFKPGFYLYGLIIFVSLNVFYIIKKVSLSLIINTFLVLLCTLGFQISWMFFTYKTFKLSYIDDITTYRYFNSSIIAQHEKVDLLQLMKKRDFAFTQLPFHLLVSPEEFKDFHLSIKAEHNLLLKNYPKAYATAFFDNIFSNYHTGNAIIRDINVHNLNNEATRKAVFNYTRIWNMLFGGILVLSSLYFMLSMKKLFHKRPSYLVFLMLLYSYCYYSILISGVSFYQGDRFNVGWMPFLPIILCLLLPSKRSTRNESFMFVESKLYRL